MPKMSTVLFERHPGQEISEDGWQSGSMRVIPHTPLYQFSNYNDCWKRIIMMEDGMYLRVCLTPADLTINGAWDSIVEGRILWSGSHGDKIMRELPPEVMGRMDRYLGKRVADRLLTGDLWAEIALLWPDHEEPYNITDWLARNGYARGIALSAIQKNPPTWADRRAAQARAAAAVRKARIAEAVGSAPPLSEEELALGKSLEEHDWAHEWSDSGDMWRHGKASKEKLQKQLLALSVERRKIVWKAFVLPYNEQYWKCPM